LSTIWQRCDKKSKGLFFFLKHSVYLCVTTAVQWMDDSESIKVAANLIGL